MFSSAVGQKEHRGSQSQQYSGEENEHTPSFLVEGKDSQHHQSAGAHAARNNVGRHAPRMGASCINRVRFVGDKPVLARIGVFESRQVKKQEQRDRQHNPNKYIGALSVTAHPVRPRREKSRRK